MRSARVVWIAACAACALGCGATGQSPPASATASIEAQSSRAMRYAFVISDELTRVDATVCFEGEPANYLVPGVRAGRGALVGAGLVTRAGERPLAVDERGISLAGVGRDACVRYRLDLARVEEEPFELGMRRHEDALVTNTALWLWGPLTSARGTEVTARFEGPSAEGGVAVPWSRDGDAYRLDASAFAFSAHAVFGHFERESVELAGEAVGTRLDVVVLDGLSPATRAAVKPWIEAAAVTSVLPSGRLAVERAQVVVIPAGASDDPVLFGHTTRGGGISVALLVAEDATREALLADWTAVHELSHLWLPFLRRQDVWLSEGLATYYQEVLRARARRIPRAQAWWRFWSGAERGRDAKASLVDESARVFDTMEFKRVYWGGAAIALLADAEIRQRSQGEKSLDDVMEALGRCCARDSHPWEARTLVERMDAVLGAPVFAELLAREASSPRYPDLGPLFERMGLVPRGDTVEMRSAPESWIADAIMGDTCCAVGKPRVP